MHAAGPRTKVVAKRVGAWPCLCMLLALGACGSKPSKQLAGTAAVSGASPGSPADAAGASAAAGSSGAQSANTGQPTSGFSAAGAGAPASSGGAGTTVTAADGGGGAQAAGAAGTGTAGDGSIAPTGTFPAVSDLSQDGPFQSTLLENTGPNGNYTVYLPTELAPNGVKNPIVGWMSGGSTAPSAYPLLPHLATHGFVVVASNTVPGIGQEVELGKEIIDGIDWALAENQRDGSMLFGKLDATKIASVGYSMGSLATFTIASDPRLTTTVHISGGNMEADRVKNLHAPAAFICGTPGDSSCNILSTDCDIAAANCDTDFMNATTPVFYANFPGGHLGILTDPNMSRIYPLVTGWLRWQLMSDSTLKQMFVGDQCTTCKDPNWKVQTKNLQ